MKKFICIYIALCIISIAAFAAPYSTDYLTSSKHSLTMLLDNVLSYGWNDAAKDDISAEEPTSDTQKQPVTNRHISDVAASIAVVSKIAYSTYEGESMHKMTYYINEGEQEKECYFDSDSNSYGGAFVYEDLTPGSLVYINIDENRVVQEYCVVAVMDKDSGIPQVDFTAESGLNPSKIRFSYSYILDYGRNNGNLVIDLVDGNTLVVPSDSHMYTVEPKRTSVKIHVGDCTAGDVFGAEYDEELDMTTVYPVFSVAYKDEAVFTCAFSTAVYLQGNRG